MLGSTSTENGERSSNWSKSSDLSKISSTPMIFCFPARTMWRFGSNDRRTWLNFSYACLTCPSRRTPVRHPWLGRMVRLYIQSFWSPQLSFHTSLSLCCLQLGSPISTETKEPTKDHILVPISPLWLWSSCPYFHQTYCFYTHTTILVRALFVLSSCVKCISIYLVPLVLHDCDRWPPS